MLEWWLPSERRWQAELKWHALETFPCREGRSLNAFDRGSMQQKEYRGVMVDPPGRECNISRKQTEQQ